MGVGGFMSVSQSTWTKHEAALACEEFSLSKLLPAEHLEHKGYSCWKTASNLLWALQHLSWTRAGPELDPSWTREGPSCLSNFCVNSFLEPVCDTITRRVHVVTWSQTLGTVLSSVIIRRLLVTHVTMRTGWFHPYTNSPWTKSTTLSLVPRTDLFVVMSQKIPKKTQDTRLDSEKTLININDSVTRWNQRFWFGWTRGRGVATERPVSERSCDAASLWVCGIRRFVSKPLV